MCCLDFDVEITKSQMLVDLKGSLDHDFEEDDFILEKSAPVQKDKMKALMLMIKYKMSYYSCICDYYYGYF